MGVVAKAARAVTLLSCAALVTVGLAACGDDDARYVVPPFTSWHAWAAGVDTSGTVVLSGDNRALTVAHGDETGVVDASAFEPPVALGDDGEPRGVSVDPARHAWILVGDALVPVGARDRAVHPTSESLTAIGARDPGRMLPGAEPRLARTTTAVAVESGQDVVVASQAPLGDTKARVNVTVHRLTADGPGELLAGRAWTGTADRPAPATDIPAGETATATDVDLDEVAALQPLDGNRLLIVTLKPTTESPGVLSFFVLDGTSLRHLGVGTFSALRLAPPVTTSLLSSGRVVLNLSTGSAAAQAPAVLHLDPGAGTAEVIDRSAATPDGPVRLMVANADGGELVVVTSPGGDPEDDDNAVNIRITSTPAPTVD
jgi:hypothetical protein